MPIIAVTTPRARVRRAVLAILAMGAALSSACLGDGPTAEEPTSYLRIVQTIPNAPLLALYVDSAPTISGLTYRAIAGFVPLEAGVRRIRLIPSSGGAAIVDDSLTFLFAKAYTVVATGMLGSVQSVVAPDTAPFPIDGEFKVRVIQAAPTAGAVDVYVTDASASLATATPTMSGLQFRGVLDYITVPVGRNRIRLTTAGTTDVVLDVTQIFGVSSMRTIIATDAPGGGLPLTELILIDY